MLRTKWNECSTWKRAHMTSRMTYSIACTINICKCRTYTYCACQMYVDVCIGPYVHMRCVPYAYADGTFVTSRAPAHKAAYHASCGEANCIQDLMSDRKSQHAEQHVYVKGNIINDAQCGPVIHIMSVMRKDGMCPPQLASSLPRNTTGSVHGRGVTPRPRTGRSWEPCSPPEWYHMPDFLSLCVCLCHCLTHRLWFSPRLRCPIQMYIYDAFTLLLLLLLLGNVATLLLVVLWHTAAALLQL